MPPLENIRVPKYRFKGMHKNSRFGTLGIYLLSITITFIFDQKLNKIAIVRVKKFTEMLHFIKTVAEILCDQKKRKNYHHFILHSENIHVRGLLTNLWA